MAGAGGMSAEFLAMAEEFLQKEHVPPNPEMPPPADQDHEQALMALGSVPKARAAPPPPPPPWRAPKRVVRPDDVSTSPPRCLDKRPVSPVRSRRPALTEREQQEQWAAFQYDRWLEDQAWAEQLAEEASWPQHDDFQDAQLLPSSGSMSENAARVDDIDAGHEGAFDMDLDWEDAQEESAAAIKHGIRWRHRGPEPPQSPTEYWKGQRYRPTTQRWSRRGGRKRGFWDLVYAAMREGATKEEAIKHVNKMQSQA